MENLASNLLEELNSETAFTIPIFGGLEIAESTVMTWIIMAILVAASFLLTRNLKVTGISKRQAALESAVIWMENFATGLIGEKGKRYVPWLVTVLLYIAVANLIGIFGVKPPTKDLSVTAALALSSIILIEGAGIQAKGVGGWLKSFTQPVAVVTPINIMEIVIRPLSLCMRLFGNVLGSFVIMELIKSVMPVVVPLIFSMYFDVFDGLIQAYVFVFLTALFIQEAIE